MQTCARYPLSMHSGHDILSFVSIYSMMSYERPEAVMDRMWTSSLPFRTRLLCPARHSQRKYACCTET